MRERFVWDKEQHKFVPAEAYYAAQAAQLHGRGPMIMTDISPYRSAVTNEVIGGRRQHRDHLRKHDLVEVGNERPVTGSKPQATPVASDIKDAIEQVAAGNAGPPDETVNQDEFRMLA